MNLGLLHFFFLVLLISGSDHFDQELDNLETDTAVLIPYHGVTGAPVWLDDGNRITAQLDDFWLVIDLSDLTLLPSVWRDDKLPIGVIESDYPFFRTDYDYVSRHITGHPPQNATSLKIDDNTTLSLKTGTVRGENETRETTLSIIRHGETHRKWSTTKEVCSDLSPSPDKRFVAFTCDINGLVVLRL